MHVTGCGPDHVVGRKGGVDKRTDGTSMADRRDSADALSGRGVDEVRISASDRGNAEFGRDLLGNELGQAQIDLDQGRWDVAEVRLAKAYADAKSWVATDPANKKLVKQKIAERGAA